MSCPHPDTGKETSVFGGMCVRNHPRAPGTHGTCFTNMDDAGPYLVSWLEIIVSWLASIPRVVLFFTHILQQNGL